MVDFENTGVSSKLLFEIHHPVREEHHSPAGWFIAPRWILWFLPGPGRPAIDILNILNLYIICHNAYTVNDLFSAHYLFSANI